MMKQYLLTANPGPIAVRIVRMKAIIRKPVVPLLVHISLHLHALTGSPDIARRRFHLSVLLYRPSWFTRSPMYAFPLDLSAVFNLMPHSLRSIIS